MKQRKALTSLAFDMSPSDIKASAHRIIAAHRAVEDRVASVPLDAVSFDNVVVPLANVNAALAACSVTVHARSPYPTPIRLAVSAASSASPANRGLVGSASVMPDAESALCTGDAASATLPAGYPTHEMW